MIPVFDLDAPDPEALLQGFGQYGLLYVRGHRIAPDLLSSFYDEYLKVTARPEEEKQTWSGADIWYQRGWTPPNTETAVIAGGQPDFKECYFAAPVQVDPEMRHLYPEVYADNRWPRNSDVFREKYLALGKRLHEVGLALLDSCADALGIGRRVFVTGTSGGPHVTRALKYLPLSAEQVNQDHIVWGEEHTDFNLLTLLPGGRFFDPAGAPCARPDPDAGLYLRTRPSDAHPRGELVYGRPPEGCIVAQVGQQLEILTGGDLLATPHVITAPKQPGYSRTSMAHFIHLHSEERLLPLSKFRSEETLKSYGPPVLAGTYGMKTLVDIGLAPREALEKLGYRNYGHVGPVRD